LGIDLSEVSVNARGGTEMMGKFLSESIPSDLLDKFQIIPSRIRTLDPDKIRIFYGHDLPNDPESKPLADKGWNKFNRLVFVSHWQQQAYINYQCVEDNKLVQFNIPWSKTVVLQNAIDPLPIRNKPTDKVRIIYHTTPHRGLNILVSVFEKLAEDFKDQIHLDVYSSFELYGWKERDEPFEVLFEKIRNHPQMTYHGTVSNEEVREALVKAHIFAYPSTWPETSCICLMEAMSAGLICVHPNYAALPETAANLTWMYQWHENPNSHAQIFYEMTKEAINHILKAPEQDPKIKMASEYANIFYGKTLRTQQWINFLHSIENESTKIPSSPGFSYAS
jgi:UDP-glucose:(glucosyl)LPS alpha-1,2-glucosyltransferase